MTFRSRYLVAAVVGLCLAHPLLGQEPGPLAVEHGPTLTPQARPSVNQQIADTIAEQLRQDGRLRGYSIDVSYRDGTAEVRGTVADQPQREEALRLVQGVPGVERVVDHLTLANGPALTQVQASGEPPLAAEPPAVKPPPLAESAPALAPEPPPAVKPPPGTETPAPPASVPGAAAEGMPPEPLPMFQAPQPGPFAVNDPRFPPYAWPTYAPYNNYSRVAYPLAYPYNAWPYIGPMYPYPKIPLGWRSVKLEWMDGYWWFSKTATKYDWWRIRYW
jgi:hypothetical protein